MFKLKILFLSTFFVTVISFSCRHNNRITKITANRKGIITDPELKNLVDHLNSVLSIYDTLSIFEEYKEGELGIPRSYLDSNSEENTTEKIGMMSGSVPINYYQTIIGNYLHAILTNRHISDYHLEDILNEKYISIAYSEDHRLYDLIIDEKTGGSYKSNISFIHYRSQDGKLYNYSNDWSAADTIFAGDGYGLIKLLKTSHGTKYLLQGSVTTCNTCVRNYILLVYFEHGVFKSDWDYSLDGRDYHSPDDDTSNYFVFDDQTKTVIIKYKTDDLTTECTCGINAKQTAETDTTTGPDTLVEDDKKLYGKPCQCIFQFNGDTFVPIK
jgi:hypothetical protein